MMPGKPGDCIYWDSALEGNLLGSVPILPRVIRHRMEMRWNSKTNVRRVATSQVSFPCLSLDYCRRRRRSEMINSGHVVPGRPFPPGC